VNERWGRGTASEKGESERTREQGESERMGVGESESTRKRQKGESESTREREIVRMGRVRYERTREHKKGRMIVRENERRGRVRERENGGRVRE
jgi:hypothetical protein